MQKSQLLYKLQAFGVVTSILLLLFLSFFPTVYEVFRSQDLPSNRVLVLEHGYTPDFNLYLSKILQGQRGRWTALELYDNQPHEGSFLQIFYLLLGKIGGVFGLSPTVIYHGSRLLFGAILLSLIYLLSLKVFKHALWALVGLWMIVTVSSWPVLVWGTFGYGSFMPWWTIIDPIKRITITPHLLAGQSLLLLIVYLFFYKMPKETKVPNGIFLGMLGIILGLVFPPALLMVYGIVWGTVVLRIILNFEFSIFNKKTCITIVKENTNTFIFTLFSFPTLLYLSHMTSFYPWKRLNDYNELYPTYFPIHEFVLACGPWLVLAGVGTLILLLLYRRREKKENEANFLPMIIWAGGIFALMFVIRFVPQQNALRFTQVAHFVPIGMLATWCLKYLYELRSMKYEVWKKKGVIVLGSIVVGLGIGHMMQSLYWQVKFVDAKVEASIPEVPRFPQLMYPTVEFMDALTWIEKNTSNDAVIFAEETFGNYVPAYTGRKVYCCHANTPQSEEHLNNVVGFYYGWSFGPEKAKEWLLEQHITYIVWGPQEIETANKNGVTDIKALYPWLEEVYRNGRFVLYRISK